MVVRRSRRHRGAHLGASKRKGDLGVVVWNLKSPETLQSQRPTYQKQHRSGKQHVPLDRETGILGPLPYRHTPSTKFAEIVFVMLARSSGACGHSTVVRACVDRFNPTHIRKHRGDLDKSGPKSLTVQNLVWDEQCVRMHIDVGHTRWYMRRTFLNGQRDQRHQRHHRVNDRKCEWFRSAFDITRFGDFKIYKARVVHFIC